MAQRLKGKTAVITGGGGGIGRAAALAMAAEGAKIVINDIGRDSDGMSEADKVVEEIIKAKGMAVANYDSVATIQGGENIIKTATSNFGRVDILVNCAGNIGRVPSTVEMTEADWDSVIDVHLKGHFSCTKAAAREMIKQKSGRIINVSSRAAFIFGVSIPISFAAYATAKAGILGFTATLSAEFNKYGITVNAILPSAITKGFPDSRTQYRTGNMPVAQDLEPEYVAPIITYLALDEAKDITGRFFYSSGGDLCIYARPLEVPGGAHMFIRKMGKWTLDELSEVIPPLLA